MARGECPSPKEECPYYSRPPVIEGSDNGCYSDPHHEKFGPNYQEGLANRVRRLGQFIVQTCRWEHQTIHAEAFTTGEFPPAMSVEEMKSAIEQSQQ